MDYKTLLGVSAVIIGFVGYIPYFRDISLGKTKPHAFSWLVWGILTSIAFVGQATSKGGAGSWVTGFTACICFVIFLFALRNGIKDFPLLDWLSLIGAGVALLLWLITNGPLAAVVLVTIVDAIAFFPTFRKSISKPHEETMFVYSTTALKFAIGILALNHYSVVTVLYPASVVVSNIAFITLLLTRRKQLAGYI